jgi:elongation factor G
MSTASRQLRNIGVIAHIDAGKTTVTERMLFYAGETHKMGEVDKGTTITDFDPEEQQRGITILAASVTLKWQQTAINLIDTPGHVDFTAEVERSLRVLDGGVVVFSAREGVEAQSETVWHQADKYGVPRIAFINKMDREGADFYRTFDEIEKRLGAKPVALQIPYGVGPAHVDNPFGGVIDLVRMRLLTFTDESRGAEVVEADVPADVRDEAELYRERMLEQLFDYSNDLAERMLAEEDVPAEVVVEVVRAATLHQLIVPVLCGSALHFRGIQPLLDAVVAYLPAPEDRPPIKGVNPKNKGATEFRQPSPDEPFCGLVFKVQSSKHGDLFFVRIYSGTLEAGTRALNAGNDKKENVAQLWHVQADHRTQVESVTVGDIVGIIGLRHSITGDTLCDPRHPIVLETIVFPETVISMAIEPETSTERKKLEDAVAMMTRQDPTFRAKENEETGQTLISGMGELHLEIIKNRLLRDFNLHVRFHQPRVSYRETIAKATTVRGECHQLGGQAHQAAVELRMEPIASDQQSLVVNCVTDESVPSEYVDAAIEVLQSLSHGGGSVGFPLTKIRVELLSLEVHESDSTDVAFRHAAADAFNRGLDKAGTVMLEPIMKLQVSTPEESMGDIVADLQQRRAVIHSTGTRGAMTVIDAEVALAELFGYSSAMRGLSQGRASCSIEPSAYAPAPPEVRASFI